MGTHLNVFKQNGKEKVVKLIKFNRCSFELEEIESGVYRYSFQKSLSNIQTEGELLLLVTDITGHAPSTYIVDQDNVILTYRIKPNSLAFSAYEKAELHNQLHVLKNIGSLYISHRRGYTHILHPKNLYIDDNKLPYVLYRGYTGVCEPTIQDEGDLVRQYQALVFSLFSKKYNFEELYNGALELVKKTPFLERVYSAQTMQEVEKIIDDLYHKEKTKYENTHISMLKNRYRICKTFGISITVLTMLISSLLIWSLGIKKPFDDKMTMASSHYGAQRYSDVIQTLLKERFESLPQTQKYILARSYLEVEPMSEQNKTSVKMMLTYESDIRAFQFWIALGRDNYQLAFDVSKSMNIDIYGYIASFKAIEIIKKGTDSEVKKEKVLKVYEEEMKKYEEKLKISSKSVATTPVTKASAKDKR